MNQDTLGMFGALGIILLVVAILGFLLPVYVYMINGKLRRLNDQIDTLIKATGGSGTVRVASEALTEAIIKNLFRHRKTRYRGLAKNTAQLQTLFALANLILARRTFALSVYP